MSHLAPIETGMRNYELDSGNEQGSKGKNRDPVRDTDECSVAGSLVRKRLGRRHAGKNSTAR